MASIKQIIAEIQLAADLPPNHKAKAVQIIRDAEERLKLKQTSKPRKITNAKNLATIEEWEEINGHLAGERLWAWAKINRLDLKTVEDLINEFRDEMRSKGKQYADFVMAFQTYLRKGYLSKPMLACLEKQNTVVHHRGVNL